MDRRMRIEILVFEVHGQQFGLRSEDVLEVLRAATLTPMPNVPRAIEGLLNLRGRAVPVLNTRAMFGFPEQAMRHSDHLVLLRSGDQPVALRVDRALDLIALEVEMPEASEPKGSASYFVDLVVNTADGMVHVLDSTQLLSENEISSVVGLLADRSATEVAS